MHAPWLTLLQLRAFLVQQVTIISVRITHQSVQCGVRASPDRPSQMQPDAFLSHDPTKI